MLNFGLTRHEIEREAARLAKATILVIRHYCRKNVGSIYEISV